MNSKKRLKKLTEELKELQRFKAYVHNRLDKAGIEKNPNGIKSQYGCRIGDRLDIALQSFSDKKMQQHMQNRISEAFKNQAKMNPTQFLESWLGRKVETGEIISLSKKGVLLLMVAYGKHVRPDIIQNNPHPIDKVTTDMLSTLLKMVNISIPEDHVDNIIDLVELIVDKEDKITLADIDKLKRTWEKQQRIVLV